MTNQQLQEQRIIEITANREFYRKQGIDFDKLLQGELAYLEEIKNRNAK